MSITSSSAGGKNANARARAREQASGSSAFFQQGWWRFPYDPVLADWVGHSLAAARRAVASPANSQWLRYQGTWFAGVNVLKNDSTGAVDAGPRLAGTAVDFIRSELKLTDFTWDRAQVSVCYPGYPKPMQGESEARFRYRRDRDAAHVDGLRARGPHRRRFINEHHAFILGIPMLEARPDASPLVVWEASHERVRASLSACLAGREPTAWGDIDVTEAYQQVRREIFAACKRVLVSARPGEAYLVHRLALHGVAPWARGATAGADGRMVVYFRPSIGEPRRWLMDP